MLYLFFCPYIWYNHLGELMQKTSLELLKMIEASGFEAYIVGGFVRDYCMKKESHDVDICTSAKPKDLINIFKSAVLPKERYGSVTLVYKGIRFEITTFRKEIKYEDRKPIEIEYSNNFEEDIQRRDFTVNTLCMNSSGKIIDLLNGKSDINNRVIRVVGNIDEKFKDDPLRMLRAIRFATQLDFKLDESTVNGIRNNMQYISQLSYQRKKEELTKIFASKNIRYGIKLLLDLELDKYLELSNLDKMIITEDVLGMMSQLNILDIYSFSRLERDYIEKINLIVKNGEVNIMDLYNYGLYICQIAADILGISRKVLVKVEKKLPIRSKKDIDIQTDEICKALNKEPNGWLKEIYNNLEKEIVYGNIVNKKEEIIKYILNNH